MPTLDSTAKAAVAGQAFARASFIFLDISGDPLRVTNFGQDVTFAGTGDSDLDGNTFISFGGQFLDVSDVSQSESGSDALTVTLSGIVTLDTTLLNDIGNVALWQGRLIRTWFRIYDESGVTPQGAIVPEYTGYMSGVKVAPRPKRRRSSCPARIGWRRSTMRRTAPISARRITMPPTTAPPRHSPRPMRPGMPAVRRARGAARRRAAGAVPASPAPSVAAASAAVW
jgi:hypothetical protein